MKHAAESAIKARLNMLPGISKAWPNQDFDPSAPGNLPYVACSILRAGTSDDTLDNVAPITTGRLIATVVTAKGVGEAQADQIADQIAALFPMGLEIPTAESITQVMQPPHIRDGMTDGAYWRVPVLVPIQITNI